MSRRKQSPMPEGDTTPPQRTNMPFKERLLDVNEAGALLGLKPGTLYQWAYERRIPVVKLSGPRGPLRFRESTLLKLIETWERPALRPIPERH